MKNNKILFSTGEFAKLNGINKRTLHYYNDIGLFCPEMTGENGYHYYSFFQTIQLELILILRQTGLSIEEIKEFTQGSSDQSFLEMIHDKKRVIDKSIEQLMEAKNFLQQKLDKLNLGMNAVHGKVEEVWMPEQRILFSEPITGAYDEADFVVATDFSLRLKKLFGIYDNFGSCISTEQIMQGDFAHYSSFFAYGREDIEEYEILRPGGMFLRSFCIGGWKKLEEVYREILSYARERNLCLMGYAYEEGLNEMSLQRNGDYITMITVAYKEADKG